MPEALATPAAVQTAAGAQGRSAGGAGTRRRPRAASLSMPRRAGGLPLVRGNAAVLQIAAALQYLMPANGLGGHHLGHMAVGMVAPGCSCSRGLEWLLANRVNGRACNFGHTVVRAVHRCLSTLKGI